MPWYKTGLVSVTQNSNAVIGAGTAFIANSRVGDGFRGPDGGWYEVTNIASDTAMSIAPNYQGVTNAAGAYALAPLQGYVKDSADALRSLVNQYGAKLAALGTTGNYDILPPSKGGTGITDLSIFIQTLLNDADAAAGRVTMGAAKAGANADITALSGLTTALSIAQGGTGVTTISGLLSALMGAGAYSKSNITGLVSQVAGLPAGAILEYGINVNGAYLKLAGGVMVCWAVNRQVVFANASNLLFAWTYPVNFVGNNPLVLVNAATTFGTLKSVSTVNCYSRGLTAANCALLSLGVFVAGDVSGVFVDALAIGRWTNEG